ncbi:hypothetical protein WJX75_007229 [Coccomyxa subellipsoidea]|uniref:Uncharacterized protein n=1 Tax=Coccomyxa subellipsoidea TaxID=248742 RepID=A0ABR2YD96_9CHLO
MEPVAWTLSVAESGLAACRALAPKRPPCPESPCHFEGLRGPSRFSSAVDVWGLDRQGSHAAANVACAESPTASLPARLSSMELFQREVAPVS